MLIKVYTETGNWEIPGLFVLGGLFIIYLIDLKDQHIRTLEQRLEELEEQVNKSDDDFGEEFIDI